MRTVKYSYKKITYPDADAPLFGTQLYVKVEPDYDDPAHETPADGTDDQISVQIDDGPDEYYHSKWFGGVCWFFFDVKPPINFSDKTKSFNISFMIGGYTTDPTLIRFGSWVGERFNREFNGITLFNKYTGFYNSFKIEGDKWLWLKFQNNIESGIFLSARFFDSSIFDSIMELPFSLNEYIYYYCITEDSTMPSLDFEGWIGGYEIKPICSTLGIEPQKSKFYWVDRYGFVHTYYFEVTSITNGKGEKVEYSKTIQDTNANISYYKTSISQPKITKAFQSEDEDLKNIKDIATLGSAMYLEINDVPTDPSLISALVVPNEKGLSRLTFSVDFNVENKNVVLW